MLNLLNVQRSAHGLAQLERCGTLEFAAQAHSADQAAHSKMSHTGSDGSTMSVRAMNAHYNGWFTLGENVAARQRTVSEVMVDWMASEAHRANILRPEFVHVGIGIAAGGTGELYWTQDFGGGGSC